MVANLFIFRNMRVCEFSKKVPKCSQSENTRTSSSLNFQCGSVGEFVGENEGARVGTDGLALGETDGMPVGDAVGTVVGTDGEALGLTLGIVVLGAAEGDTLGLCDVGDAVGLAVGSQQSM